MNYPTEILPNAKYKRITCDLSNHYLIRFTHSNIREEIFDDNIKQVKQNQICSPKEHISDLSTSLLGIYIPSFVSIELTKTGKETYSIECEPDEIVEPPVFDTDFIQNENRSFWVILISHINTLIADYTKPNITDQFKATCSIEHTPMKWNFWHFSIRWDLGQNVFLHQLPPKTIAKVYKRLTSDRRATIAMFASIEEPNYSQLGVEEYCKATLS